MEETEVICDTDVIIDYLDHLQPRHLFSKQIIENSIGREFIMISAITKMELLRGVSDKNVLMRLKKNIKFFDILLINPQITSISLDLIETYKLSHNLAIPDSLIAATAIHTGFSLFTFNIKDFKFIPGLKLYNHTLE